MAARKRSPTCARRCISPRGALALAQAARATAVLHDRDYAITEDVLNNVVPVCAHRIISRAYTSASPHHLRDGVPPDSPQGILAAILDSLESPA